MSYTCRDTPEVVARIESDLQVVIDTVTKNDPHLRSFVLTGGFARGEGAVMDNDPQNDYDFIALRGRGRPLVPYDDMRKGLEHHLGIHVDLAPVAAWRLPWVSPSIFWYETAWRGKVIWGDELLGRIPVRTARRIDRREPLRLLVNRAAGLLLVSESDDGHARRVQAAKGLLAAFDTHLMAHGTFPPSQRERWLVYNFLRSAGLAPPAIEAFLDPLRWAYHFKIDPQTAPPRDAIQSWKEARRALLDAVPVALHHAGLRSLDAYAREDGVLDMLYWCHKSRSVPGARRFLRHPTGRVRLATLRLLQAAESGGVHPDVGQGYLADLAKGTRAPLPTLEALRHATLQ